MPGNFTIFGDELFKCFSEIGKHRVAWLLDKCLIFKLVAVLSKNIYLK